MMFKGGPVNIDPISKPYLGYISKLVSNPVYVITKNLRKINVRNPMGMKLL